MIYYNKLFQVMMCGLKGILLDSLGQITASTTKCFSFLYLFFYFIGIGVQEQQVDMKGQKMNRIGMHDVKFTEPINSLKNMLLLLFSLRVQNHIGYTQ